MSLPTTNLTPMPNIIIIIIAAAAIIWTSITAGTCIILGGRDAYERDTHTGPYRDQ